MANLKIALLLAYKSIIRGNRWTLVLIIMVMSLSFINLIIVPSILSGVTNTIDKQLVNTMFANVVIDPEEDEYYLDHVRQTEKKIAQIPSVVGVTSHLHSNALIEYEGNEQGSPAGEDRSGTWTVVGINPREEASVTTVHKHIIQGSYLDEGDRDEIVLGVDIAGGSQSQNSPFLTLGGVEVGDKVRLTYPNGIQREYRVKGIFRVRFMAVDQTAFVTKKEMASILGRNVFTDRASQILVRIDQTGDEGSFIGELEALGINGEIRSWQEYSGAMGGIASSLNTITTLLSSIGLMVAAIVMFIVIYISVINKKRQIGILRALGISSNVIIYSYLIQALFYVTFGIIFGWLLIWLLMEPYFINNPLDLPMGLVSLSINPSTVKISILGLILAAILAGFIPVRNITRQSIIKTIWGD